MSSLSLWFKKNITELEKETKIIKINIAAFLEGENIVRVGILPGIKDRRGRYERSILNHAWIDNVVRVISFLSISHNVRT